MQRRPAFYCLSTGRLLFPVLTSEAECLCFANITVNAGVFFFFFYLLMLVFGAFFRGLVLLPGQHCHTSSHWSHWFSQFTSELHSWDDFLISSTMFYLSI